MQPYRKAAFYTLGCKLNFSETSALARSLENAGYARVAFEDCPDVFVVNTCSVTDNADKKCRAVVRRARRINPDAFVIVVGCYAQLKPEEISKMPGVNLVLGAQEKFNLAEHIAGIEKGAKAEVVATHIKEVKEFVPSYSLGDRTRTFFKVQDGCDYFCSFCTIPLARGRSRSTSIAETVARIKEVGQENVQEIVLTGVNIGDFGAGSKENLFGLIQELDKLSAIPRFRISSIEPNLTTDSIISFVAASERFMPHFHLPLQSGSNVLLQSMRRRYEVADYIGRVERIKSQMPDACIGVDVIVGYPGETDIEFQKTYELLKELPVSYLHVFTYSERANTTAVRMEVVVPQEIRSERSKMLRILSEKKKLAFYETQIGSVRPVLFEEKNEDGMIYGFTDNYVKVQTNFDPQLINTIVEAKLIQINSSGVMDVSLLQSIPAQLAS